MKKIVITGPESSGKTTLSAQLAAHFGTVWVPEYSRQYLTGLNRPYSVEDLLAIAKGQTALEDEMASIEGGFMFLDTSLEVIKVWSEVRFGYCDPLISEMLLSRLPDYYLLCLPDLPWEPDPLRENPTDRLSLLEIYRAEIAQQGVPVSELCSLGAKRLDNAVIAVEAYLNFGKPRWNGAIINKHSH